LTIYLARDVTQISYIPQLQTTNLAPYNGEIQVRDSLAEVQGGWGLSWAFVHRHEHNAAMETGFWWQAIHIDQHGLYGKSSFNHPEAVAEIEAFKAPKPVAELVAEKLIPNSKYRQGVPVQRWDGVVLAMQVPHDRSVKSVGHYDAYWDFYRGACAHYGKHLYVKLHPLNTAAVKKQAMEIAVEHGCCIGETDHSVLAYCKFVLVYNSTFCVDCFVRRVPVAQFAPGYFYKSGAVTYTEGTYPDDVNDTVPFASRVADFCAYRYCFNYNQPLEQWIAMLRHFASSDALFPMQEQWCYVRNLHHGSQKWTYVF
jgi:hypothetical protein